MGLWTRARKNVQKETSNLSKKISAEKTRVLNRLIFDEQDKTGTSSCISNEKADCAEEVIINKNIAISIAGNGNENIQETAKLPVSYCSPTVSNLNLLNLKPGLAYIVNHRTFVDDELGERVGSDVDVKNIEEVLARFSLTTKIIHDGTKQDVELVMAEVEEYNFSTYSCLIFVIMSHGYENDILAAKDGHYSLNKHVLYPILRNATLVGKPKIIFVQSCKGITDLALAVDGNTYRGLPTKTPDEILQFHSCVEGYVSYRSPIDGSIFIEKLCQKLKDFGEVKDIREVCRHVIRAVKEEYVNMQIPMLHENLTSQFVLGHYKT